MEHFFNNFLTFAQKPAFGIHSRHFYLVQNISSSLWIRFLLVLWLLLSIQRIDSNNTWYCKTLTFCILMLSTSVKNGAIFFSETTFIAVPSASYEASRTSGAVSLTVYHKYQKNITRDSSKRKSIMLLFHIQTKISLLALRLPRLGKKELILVLFIHLFDLHLFGFVSWCLRRAVAYDCGTNWTFLLPFFFFFFFQ